MTDQATASPTSPAVPDWVATAGSITAFWYGLGAMFATPGYVLVAGSVGFGALARDMGIDVGIAMWMSVVFYALPGQVVLADQIGRGASILAAAFAVSLTAVRLLPMTVTLVPYMRDPRRRRWLEILAVHFIAVTAWIEGHRRLGALPEHLRLPHFLGFGIGFMICTVGGSAIGFVIAAIVPVAVTAALLFFTPLYFMLSLVASSRRFADFLAIGLGVVIGPTVYVRSPDLDLLVAGLVGGTIAYLAGRPR